MLLFEETFEEFDAGETEGRRAPTRFNPSLLCFYLLSSPQWLHFIVGLIPLEQGR